MINTRDILETITMIQEENLDIRTITMGISLLDCCDSDLQKACGRIYEKITRKAERLVRTGEEIEREFGIPIINKRISVTPIAMICGASGGDPVEYALTLERAAQTVGAAAKAVGVNFIGGYSALVQKGFAAGDEALIRSIPEALSRTEHVCSSVNIGSTKAGINMDAVGLMGKIVREAAAFHGAGEPDCVINVGVSGPGVVRAALAKAPDCDLTGVADLIKRTAFKITRMGQLVAHEASKRLDVPFGIVDLSLAPTPAVGDSVAHILEEMGLEKCGGHGTTAALALLNDAVKKGGTMASSHVGGLSGAFIPVTEDAGMIDAARCGALSIEKLEAMTAVCSVGLDMIAIPGDTPAEVISAIIADEAAIGMVNSKTTAVRVIPAIGKQVGEELSFGGLLGGGPVMALKTTSPAKFIARGGRIPAPLQSLKN